MHYTFSIIVPVYNVEKYLVETIDSIINQTFPFEKVQLLLIDDGSSDNSADICNQYSKSHTNIQVICKENGGVSSARNMGLDFATGDYVGFLDSDDCYSSTVLEKVHDFFKNYHNETPIVCIPRFYFDAKSGPNNLNYKFDKGSRVIDLNKEYTMIQNVSSASFFIRDFIKNIRFDGKLRYSEDTKFVLEVLKHTSKMGVITGCQYNYRKRSTGNSSAVDSMRSSNSWYMPPLRYLTEEVLNHYISANKVIPDYIQYTLMYELSWKVHVESIPCDVLSNEEFNLFFKKFNYLLKYISNKVIMNQKTLYIEHKLQLLAWKYRRNLEESIVQNDVLFCFSGTTYHRYSKNRLTIEFLDIHHDTLFLEGSLFLIPPKVIPEIVIMCNGGPVDVFSFDRHQDRYSLGCLIKKVCGFKATIPLMHGNNKIEFMVKYGDAIVNLTNVQVGKFCPIAENIKMNQVIENYLVSINNNILAINLCNSLVRLTCNFEYLRKLPLPLYKKIKMFGFRIIVLITKPLFKNYWLISDRINKADDNGEAFFKYLHEKDVNAVFLIDKSAADYGRLKRYGKVVPIGSIRHKLLYCTSKYNISSQADLTIMNPLGNQLYYYTHKSPDFIFLQHGVTKDNISHWLNKYNQNLSRIIVTSDLECKSFIEYDYFYEPNQIINVGFPRWDYLINNPQKKIIFMPTWRSFLVSKMNEDGTRNTKTGFTDSTYYKIYCELFSNNELFDIADRYGYKIMVMYHPNMKAYLNVLPHDNRLTICPFDTSYSELFSKGSLIVTDYSSTVFDFAYMGKPVLYYQPDYVEFFSGQHTYTKGYFDYNLHGFGEVETELSGLLERVEEYLKNNCVMKPKYLDRVNKFFTHRDKDNCDRLYAYLSSNDDC